VLPDISVVWVILAVLVLALVLDRLLFKPLVRVMRERDAAVKSAMDLAHTAAAKAESATAEFDAKVTAARADLYKQMDDRRKVAEQYRADLMAKTREEVDASLAAAKTQLDEQSAAAKAQLERDADTIGKEIAQKVLGRTVVALLCIAGAASLAYANAPEAAAAAEHGAKESNLFVLLSAKLLNFAILVATLVYFLRSPFNNYLAGRKTTIRSNLVKAAEMKEAAASQLTAVDQKMAELPGELETLRKAGAAEVVSEEARVRELAQTERQRLLTQMDREITQHGKAAERDLLRTAADRAIAVAAKEVKDTITPVDQSRLIDRYVTTLSS
jgi:F-type H+-transporting ATPase subunit b